MDAITKSFMSLTNSIVFAHQSISDLLKIIAVTSTITKFSYLVGKSKMITK